MTNSKDSILKIVAIILLMAGLTGPAIAGSLPDAVKVNATLVWGSKDVPDDKKLMRVGKGLQTKLRKALKWEHYFEINRKSLNVGTGQTQRFRMSKKCEVEIKRLNADQLNVKLIGEGKVVVSKKHSLAKEDSVVMGGPCKDKTAWFVVLQFD
jgi:hypothetical protein